MLLEVAPVPANIPEGILISSPQIGGKNRKRETGAERYGREEQLIIDYW